MTLLKNKLGSWAFPRLGNLVCGEVTGGLEGASLRWRFEGVDAMTEDVLRCPSCLVLLRIMKTASSAGLVDRTELGVDWARS